MKLLIKNIKGLVVTGKQDVKKLAGKELGQITLIQNAYLCTEDGLIEGFGPMHDLDEQFEADELIDAQDSFVLPAWCDSHTHLVYAGSREKEFVDRTQGLSYEEIAKRGGGILNSAKKLRETPEEELLASTLQRVDEIIRMGTGAVEIKSGYGLSVESEIKMLRVIAAVKKRVPIPVKATFLGAHAIPAEYKNDRNAYIQLIIEEMIPQVKEEGLAEYIDVFCDRGFFTPQETDRLLKAGIEAGMRPKIHANELDYSGGIQAGVRHSALSVDHLEFTGEEEIQSLLNADTMPTLLPSTAFFLKLHYPPARKMIDSGLPVALATDYNPGSSPSGKMTFVISLACNYMQMTPEEAIQAATLNGAYAMGIEKTHGSIAIGKTANLILTKGIPSLAYIPYAFGSDLVKEVILNGKVYTGLS